MSGQESLSVLHLVANASAIALVVLAILLALLFVGVWFIIRKHKVLRSIRANCDAFEQAFWSGRNLEEIENDALDGRFGTDGLASVFVAGNKELKKMQERKVGQGGSATVAENVRRAMESAAQLELRKLHQHMPFIATVGSVSPYIGLFGTVWGIINAFQALSTSQQVTLAQVAPGIAEALIATAMGLLAAIPAVIAFNFFADEIEQLSERYERHVDQFSNILYRNL